MIQRNPITIALSGVLALLGSAYYLQYVEGLEPCPLCMLQRYALMAIALVLSAAWLHRRRSSRLSVAARRIYGGVVGVAAGAGGGVAIRHLYLQSLPPEEVPACGPGFDYLFDALPAVDALRAVLLGSGECAEVTPVLGLPISVWTLAAFAALAGVGLLLAFVRVPESER